MTEPIGVELAPGYTIPRIIAGCWQLSSDHGGGSSSQADIDRRLAELVDSGFTTLDCADIYTGVEEAIGRFLRGYPRRSVVQVHTKLVPDRADLEEFGPARIEAIIDRSLSRLGVERLDLVQLHWWDYQVPGYVDAAVALDDLRAAGKVRLIGLTNFDQPRLKEIRSTGVEIVSHQVQYSLLDRRPETGIARTCESVGAGLLCYGTLAGGLLTDRYLNAAAPDRFEHRSITKYLLIVDEVGGWQRVQELLEVLAQLAERHGVSLATVATRWVLDRQGVAAVILGTGRSSRVAEHRAAIGLRLTEDDRRELETVLERVTSPAGDVYSLERDPGGPHYRILRMNLSREAS